MKKSDETELLLFRIRERRRLHEIAKREARRNSQKGRKSYHSIPVDILAASVASPRCKDGTVLISMPRNLSLIGNPKEVISIVKKLCASTRNKKTSNVILDYSDVDSLDLAAECLLGIVAMEVKQERANKRKKLRFQGKYPKNASYKRLIKGIGVIRSLDIKHELLSDEEEQKLRIFRYANRKHSDEVELDTADTNARVSAKFVEHINSCLADNQKQLNSQARMELSEYTGEIIGNAEDHSGMFHWYIFGYLDNTTDEHTCEVVILNFGKSITETFEDLPKDHYAYKQIYPYIQLHSAGKFFSPTWTQQDLFTLIALQGNVSSKNESDKTTRGQGTVELIDFFQNVHKECTNGFSSSAKMTLVSGNTHILFDGSYKMQADDKGRKRIALNKSNSLYDKPDHNVIGSMGGVYFPGTIIAISFPMAVNHTETLKAN